MSDFPFLSAMIFTPLAGALLLAFVGRDQSAVHRQGAFLVSLLPLALMLLMLSQFDASAAGYQFEERHEWVPSLGMSYHVGVDGLSILLLLLTTLTAPLVFLSTWKAVPKRVKEFQIALLLLETASIGALLALDLILFYLFWEAILIPAYLLLGVWGGSVERRIPAAMQFFIYTLAGSMFMLLAIIYLWSTTPAEPHTFDLTEILRFGTGHIAADARWWLFAAFAFAFAIKIPIFPFHTWLPEAYAEAPTASVVLAGAVLKVGGYGFLRIGIPLFPGVLRDTPISQWISWLAVIGIIYAACLALVQTDIKKVIAYSSISHLGLVVLGMFLKNTFAVQGAVLQMFNHGISTGMLFLLLGILLERHPGRDRLEFGGLAKTMPIFSTFFLIATLASIGLPGLSGFVGEILILFGTFQVNWLWGVLAATGVVLGAAYMLPLVKDLLYGPLPAAHAHRFHDCTAREICYLVPLAGLILWIGLYPAPFLALIGGSVDRFLQLSF